MSAVHSPARQKATGSAASSRWARLLRRFAVVIAACTLIPVLMLYVMQDQMIYLPNQDVPLIDDVLPGAVEVTYETSDGLELVGWYLEAPTGVATRNPVVMFHGTEGNRSGMASLARPIADLGHPVLLAEYRGYGGMASRPSEAGLPRDAQAAIATVSRLTVGGTHDRTLPGQHSEQLFDVASEPKELVMIDGADHDLVGPNGPELFDVVAAFLDTHL